MEGARAELSAQRPQGRRIRQLILGKGLASRRVVDAATAGAAVIQRTGWWWLVPRRLRAGLTGLRKVPMRRSTRLGTVHPAVGPERGAAALLAGCVMDPWFGAVHDATVDLLAAAGYSVTVPESQTCCGALAAHDGAADAAHRLAERNVSAFEGFDVVVVNSAGCGAHLKQYGHWAGTAGAELGSRVRDVTEVLAMSIEEGRLPVLEHDRGAVAVQDPCHLRHAQRITLQPRRVLEAAGYDPVELGDDGLCCGAAGVYSVLRPATSAELGRRKAAQILATGSTVVATANPGCEIQLRSHLPRWADIRHPVELYYRALTEAAAGRG
jgi:glycolate oxidase iron-sulfur subunit